VKIPARATVPRTEPDPESSWSPRVVQTYLLPYEHLGIVVRKHPGVFLGHGFVVVCSFIAALLATALTDSGVLILGVVWGVFAVLLAWLAVRAAAWLKSYFVVTRTRLIFITGLMTTKAVSVPLREIGALEGRRSPLGRLFGYGEFVAEPATPGYVIPRMNHMPYAEQLLAEIHGLMYPEDGGD
jgi:hypothetical protein